MPRWRLHGGALDDRVLEHSAVTVITAFMNPVAAQAGRMAVQRNTGMLGGPHRWIAAMCCLVRAAQFLASLPQTRRTVHPLRHDLPIDNEMHSAERMQGFVVGAPSGCSVRRCACQWHRRVRPARTIPRHCSTPERSSLRSGGALARHRSVSAASSSEPPASVGLACRPVGAWRRQLVKQFQCMEAA